MIRVTTFKSAPPFAQGLVRDMRVRWALEEAGLPYEVRLIDFEEKEQPAYCAQQPFAQAPLLEEDGKTLFESGAIVLHIGAKSEQLLPAAPDQRDRAVTWLVAALNTMEVVIAQLVEIDIFHNGEAWTKERRPQVEAAVRRRLGQLSAWLGDKDYLEGAFSVGDLMMITVLRILRHTDLLEAYPNLLAYKARGEARPAFQRALAAHMATFANVNYDASSAAR